MRFATTVGTRARAASMAGAAALLCLGAACVIDAPYPDPSIAEGGGTVQATRGSRLPLAEGNSWTYRVTEDGEVTEKKVTVEPEEEVGGEGPHRDLRAFRLVTTEAGAVASVAWFAHEDDRVVRVREQEIGKKSGEVETEEHWDPPRLVVDESRERTKSGARWDEEYEETKIEDGAEETQSERDGWIVDAVDQPVTVPAGTFRALVLQRTGGSKPRTYWFVEGIGKVKEEGDQLEELVEYEVSP